MSQTRWRGSVVGSSPATASDQEIDRDTALSVTEAYITATAGSEESRRGAFEAALRAYRACCPGVSETLARRRVAKILCSAGGAEPLRSIG